MGFQGFMTNETFTDHQENLTYSTVQYTWYSSNPGARAVMCSAAVHAVHAGSEFVHFDSTVCTISITIISVIPIYYTAVILEIRLVRLPLFRHSRSRGLSQVTF